MLKVLKEINENIRNEEVHQELKDNNITYIKEYMVISDEEDKRTFKQNYQILKDKNTVSLGKGYTLLAQTIDGDYLIGLGKRVYIVDRSLDKNMVEIYEGVFINFLIDYLEGKIKSNILAENE